MDDQATATVDAAPQQLVPQDFEPTMPVVALGASAGGLAVLRSFFEAMPADTGAVFVVVVHLSPDHESYLPELLQLKTSMAVRQVRETTALEPNTVYVIPPGCNLTSVDTHLRLGDFDKPRGQRNPIDHFFRTLAGTHGPQAIGVVLSGTGSDGALGLRRIKERGGLTIVQDPNEAQYDGMPQSAITTGMVDLVLPSADIPGCVVDVLQTRPDVVVPEEEDAELPESVQESVKEIFAAIRGRLGHEFTGYKRSTIMRRIARRMQLHKLETLPSYVALLHSDPAEVQALFEDLLIVVTNFFRDPEAYAVLEREVIPKLFEGKGPDDQLRAWSVGCATGEEAYSLAMLLLEHADEMAHPPSIQIFASDLHDHSLQRAREGFYPQSIEADVSAERLARFFVAEPDGYRVRQEVREAVVFAPHNLIKDPPFSRIDLVTCRNLLIYLQREVQRDVFSLFHYALCPGGYLFLGSSESLDCGELFTPATRGHNIFRRQNNAAGVRLPRFLAGPFRRHPDKEERPEAPVVRASYGELHQRMVERYAPPSILVDEHLDIVHFSAHAGPYMQQPGGEPTNNLMQRVRDELRTELRALIFAAEEGLSAHSHPIALRVEGEERHVIVSVRPATEDALEGLLLVLFDEVDRAGSHDSDGTTNGEPRDDASMRHLERELEATRRRLRALAEEYDTTREEMRASNEELQSANEELRSTMEELETSKEELQSMNEELTTVNQENKHKVAELAQLSADLQNLMAATEIPTLFLDPRLCIQRFTPQVVDLFNIRHTDRGRPLSDLTHKLGDDSIADDARRVLEGLTPIEREVESDAGRWYLMRILPYRTPDDRIDGVVITLVDITALKAAELALRQAVEEARKQAADAEEGRQLLDAVLDHVPEGITIAGGPEMTIHRVSRHGAAMVGLTPEQFEGAPLRERVEAWGLHHLDGTTLAGLDELPLARAINEGEEITGEEWLLRGEGDELIPVLCNAGPIRDADGKISGGVVAWRDITTLRDALEMEGMRQRERELKNLAGSLEERVQERTRQVRALASRLTRAEQQERRRISQILHDDLQQVLFGLELKLSALQGSEEVADGGAVAGELAEAVEWLDIIIAQARQLSVDLSPPILQGEGLTATLRWLGTQIEELHGLKVELQAAHSFAGVDHDLRVLLFQIVRELLFNIVKHADVPMALVELEEDDDELVIRVQDTGKGFDPAKLGGEDDAKAGLGLRSVEERLRLFGGELRIDSAPGEGSRIEIHVPKGATSMDG